MSLAAGAAGAERASRGTESRGKQKMNLSEMIYEKLESQKKEERSKGRERGGSALRSAGGAGRVVSPVGRGQD